MKLDLDTSKFNSTKFIRSIANYLSEKQILKNIGDSFVDRKATKVTIFTHIEHNNNQLIFLDNGEMPIDICITKDVKIEISELDSFAPLLFNSVNKSSLISLNFYDKKEQLNTSIEIDFKNNSPESLIKQIDDPFLKKTIRDRPHDRFFALIWSDFIPNNTYRPVKDQFVTFVNQMRQIYELRYHKLLQNEKLKIIDAPRIPLPWKGRDPVHIRKSILFKQINFTKFTLKYLILPNNLNSIDIQAVSSNKSLKGTGGFYFYDSNEILLEDPDFYGLDKKAHIPQSKIHLLDLIRFEIYLKDTSIKEILSHQTFQIKITNIIKELIADQKIQKVIKQNLDDLDPNVKIFIKNEYDKNIQKLDHETCIKNLKNYNRDRYHSYIEGLNND